MAGRSAGGTFELAGYDVEELVGSGAAGEVWRGREHATGDVVALKRVHGGAGVEARDRLRREAAVLAVLDHPHVLRLRRLLAPGDDLVLVLDHADGGSLARVLAARGRLTAGECVTVGVPLAQALAAVHARGLLHGDLSPGNVLFTGDGRPLLADLGLARVLDYDAAAVAGSRGFLDPALRLGQDPGPPADVHGLGAVLHAALGGQAPYDDQGVRGPALGDLARGAPAALVAAIERALAADPQERPGAGELAAALFAAAPARPVQLVGPGMAVVEGSAVGVSAVDVSAGGPAGPGVGAEGPAAVGLGSSRVARLTSQRPVGRHRVLDPGAASPQPGRAARHAVTGNDGAIARRLLWRRRRFDAARARGAALAPETLIVARPGRAASDSASGAGGPRGDRALRERERALVAIAGPVGVLTALAAVVVAAVLIGLAWAARSDLPASAALGAGASASPADDGAAGPTRSGPPGAASGPSGSPGASGTPGPTGASGLSGAASAAAADPAAAAPAGAAPAGTAAGAAPDGPRSLAPPGAGDSAPAELRAVLAGLDARRSTAYAEGDAALLASLYAPGSAALRRDLDNLAALLAEQRRAVGFRSVLSSARVLRRDADSARLVVVDRIPAFSLVGDDGQVVAREPGRGQRTFTVTLRRVGERWLYDEVTAAG